MLDTKGVSKGIMQDVITLLKGAHLENNQILQL